MRYGFEHPPNSGTRLIWSGSIPAFLKYDADKQNSLMVSLMTMDEEDAAGLRESHSDSSFADLVQLKELLSYLLDPADRRGNGIKPAPEVSIVACALACKKREICSICHEEMVDPEALAVATTCKHVFCRACIVQWVSKKQICPMCRGSTKGALFHLGPRDLSVTRELVEPCPAPDGDGPITRSQIRKKRKVQRVIDLI